MFEAEVVLCADFKGGDGFRLDDGGGNNRIARGIHGDAREIDSTRFVAPRIGGIDHRVFGDVIGHIRLTGDAAFDAPDTQDADTQDKGRLPMKEALLALQGVAEALGELVMAVNKSIRFGGSPNWITIPGFISSSIRTPSA